MLKNNNDNSKEEIQKMTPLQAIEFLDSHIEKHLFDAYREDISKFEEAISVLYNLAIRK